MPVQRRRQRIVRLPRQAGVTSTEMVLIAGLAVLAVIAIVLVFRTNLTDVAQTIGGCITRAIGGDFGCSGGGGAAASGASSALAPGAQPPGGPRVRTGGIASGLVVVPSGSQAGAPVGGTSAGGNSAQGAPGTRTVGGVPISPYGGPLLLPGALGGAGAGAPLAVGSAEGLLGELAANPGVVGTVAGEGVDAVAAGQSGATMNATIARYGKWMGSGWSGGSETSKVGALPPVDAMDALAQEHDFAYAIAEEAGRLYGEAEKNRLLALADANGYAAFQQLPKDPKDWVPPPPDLDEARRYRDRFPVTMQGLAMGHERDRKNSPPPTPEQAAALAARGPMDGAQLAAQARERVGAWAVDRGTSMRARNQWK